MIFEFTHETSIEFSTRVITIRFKHGHPLNQGRNHTCPLWGKTTWRSCEGCHLEQPPINPEGFSRSKGCIPNSHVLLLPPVSSPFAIVVNFSRVSERFRFYMRLIIQSFVRFLNESNGDCIISMRSNGNLIIFLLFCIAYECNSLFKIYGSSVIAFINIQWKSRNEKRSISPCLQTLIIYAHLVTHNVSAAYKTTKLGVLRIENRRIIHRRYFIS